MDRGVDRALFLRRSLQVDGVATGLCGVILLVAAQSVSELIGLPTPRIASGVGTLLLVYAVALLWNASRPRINRGEALVAVVLNAAWVAGSAAVIVVGPLTFLGNLAVAVVAVAVLAFDVLEAVGLRRRQEA
jgi:hypothetical protein